MTMTAANPLLETWLTPFEAPPFGTVNADHFLPAFEAAFAEHKAEIAAIASASEAPTFGNTVVALESAGRLLDRVNNVFANLISTIADEALEEIERAVEPRLARHEAEIFSNEALFKRVDALVQQVERLGLTAEERQLLKRLHIKFIRAGAKLIGAEKARFNEILETLAGLYTRFRQNVMADERGYALILEGQEDLAGLPDFLKDAAAAEASARGKEGLHAISLSRSLIEPFLQFSARRDLRAEAFRAWAARGDAGTSDNKPLIAEILSLRIELARLLGYRTYADFQLADRMAGSAGAAKDLLLKVWRSALRRAGEEREALAARAREEGDNEELSASDWRYYAEKVRKERFDLDEAEIKPYFQLENMIEAAFDCASRLFGLSFSERRDIPVYHGDVRVFEVRSGGRHIGLFYGDYFARAGKRSGAWMSYFRAQRKLGGDVRPLIINVCNFTKPPAGRPALLSLQDARTLFHEFGHGLHGLLSEVTYPGLAGTNVLQDFVELPSQIYEHWLFEKEVLRRFARHAETGMPIPDALIDRILAAKNFGQGFATVEFTASALVDMALHEKGEAAGLDVGAFEAETLKAIGMPDEIIMRHRLPHFAHIFATDSYAAGYYSYMWSEILDADGFGAFKEAGDIFDPPTAERLYRHIYSAGGSAEPAELYRAFRGRDPKVEPLLAGRGLSD